MRYITLIGSIAAFCTTISFLPQVLKVYRTKRTHDLSLPMYVLFLFGVAMWLHYGFLTDSLPVIIANGVTFFLCGYIIWMKVRYK